MLQSIFSNFLSKNYIKINLEFIRWRRKPRWLPVAKSKVFRVPERKTLPSDEYYELMRLHNNYRTQMRSLRSYLAKEVIIKSKISSADHLVTTPEQDEQEFQRILAINNAWNEKIAIERNQRLENESLKRKQMILEKVELAKERKEEKQREIEEIVRREKERAKNFITKENLDAAIEFALANPVDYNFSIDINENIYRGRNTLPDTEDKEKTAELSSSQ